MSLLEVLAVHAAVTLLSGALGVLALWPDDLPIDMLPHIAQLVTTGQTSARDIPLLVLHCTYFHDIIFREKQ